MATMGVVLSFFILASHLTLPAYANSSDCENLLLRYRELTPGQMRLEDEITPAPRQLRAVAEIRNQAALNALASSSVTHSDGISFEVIREIHERIYNHEVAGLKNAHRYDPDDDGICYGRAEAVVLEARSRNIADSALKKIWARLIPSRAGPIEMLDPPWVSQATRKVLDAGLVAIRNSDDGIKNFFKALYQSYDLKPEFDW